MMRRILLTTLLAVLACFLALAGATGGVGRAQAQGAAEDLVDLSVDIHTDTAARDTIFLKVTNSGNLTAYDVEVLVEVTFPAESSGIDPGHVPVGEILFRDGNDDEFRWFIPKFEGYSTSTATVLLDIPKAPMYEIRAIVTSKGTYEYPVLKLNNELRVVVLTDHEIHAYVYLFAGEQYGVDVSVADRFPSPGATVNFTITGYLSGANSVFFDGCVTIELTDGLAAGTPAFDPNDVGLARHTTKPRDKCQEIPDGMDGIDGIFEIGTRRSTVAGSQYTMTLPVTVAGNAEVSEQCLTARIFARPRARKNASATRHFDDVSNNEAKLCLGLAPDEKVVFRSGTMDLWKLNPCVGVTSPPCDNADSIELTTNLLSHPDNLEFPYTVFQPDNVVVHIPD